MAYRGTDRKSALASLPILNQRGYQILMCVKIFRFFDKTAQGLRVMRSTSTGYLPLLLP